MLDQNKKKAERGKDAYRKYTRIFFQSISFGEDFQEKWDKIMFFFVLVTDVMLCMVIGDAKWKSTQSLVGFSLVIVLKA